MTAAPKALHAALGDRLATARLNELRKERERCEERQPTSKDLLSEVWLLGN